MLPARETGRGAFIVGKEFNTKQQKSHKNQYKSNDILTKSNDYSIIRLEKGGDSMSITASELKMNLGKYLRLSLSEDVYITKNGKIIAMLTNPFQDRVNMVNSLVGIIPAEVTLEEARQERLSKI